MAVLQAEQQLESPANRLQDRAHQLDDTVIEFFRHDSDKHPSSFLLHQTFLL